MLPLNGNCWPPLGQIVLPKFCHYVAKCRRTTYSAPFTQQSIFSSGCYAASSFLIEGIGVSPRDIFGIHRLHPILWLKYKEFGGTEMTTDFRIPSYQSTCCLITKRTHSGLAIKIEINILSHKAAKTPYTYQTTTTINGLWEAKNAQEMESSFSV